MANLTFVRCLAFMILIGVRIVFAVPLDAATNTPSSQPGADTAQITTDLKSSNQSISSPAQQPELEAATSEQKQIPASMSPNADNSGNGNLDSSAAANSMYAGFLTPEAIQQYISQ
ncbi:uncharacterized protein LOC118738203 [Rhagoletis pomonella]|uniref:uncharacterized protein LOC118738203 n=1 Tax=Rhagoletis pomonella TaxID=28610 RepID=UPI0017834F1E|nr:uncharacterized protein LOC118738203 [Rhagoletis pomonella]